mgnify:CR=1 FL=1
MIYSQEATPLPLLFPHKHLEVVLKMYKVAAWDLGVIIQQIYPPIRRGRGNLQLCVVGSTYTHPYGGTFIG